MTRHESDFHALCEHPDCNLWICYDRTRTPHGGTVEPGCAHGHDYCIDHMWTCTHCLGEARADAGLT